VISIQGGTRAWEETMTERSDLPDELPEDLPELPDAFHRERREHGGASQHLDDDRLARLTEEERVEAGLEPDEAEGDA
jgi:hypothetical protein